MNVLLVEDDLIIASGLSYSLSQEGHTVTHCVNVPTAAQAIQVQSFHFVIVDLMLQGGSGFDICKMVKQSADIPVIFLTAIDDEGSVVMGLDMGADDYITKPFRIRELLSRMKSICRRYDYSVPYSTRIPFAQLVIDTTKAKVYRGEQEIILTSLEYRLLLIFAHHEGQILSRDQLLQHLWDVAGDFVNDNTLTVYIKRLREKIEIDPQQPTIITTVRGLGYRGGQ